MNVTGRRNMTGATWFVTRKYPPRIGGMELLSWELTTRIAKRRRTRVLALRRGSVWLPFFLVRSAVAILANGALGRIAILHLGDPVLAPLGRLAKQFKIPACVTVHGLDVTYTHPLYRLWLRTFFADLDAYICISSAARDAAIASGAPAARTSIVGIGVAPTSGVAAKREADLLLFVGRLVPRKGLEWFVRMVMPRLVQRRPGVRLAIIGAGPERATIRNAAAALSVEDRIEWLGALPDAERSRWFARAALCILPNVRVPGDIEGYGIVALEAAAAGCPLIASNLEGLRDAIVDGEGGRLVATEDTGEWIAAITELLDDPIRAEAAGARARAWVRAERDWESVCDRYEVIFDSRVAATIA
jgi:glycosyltransferase involved in cell wall biosynthesis